jgi:hypothetical protein
MRESPLPRHGSVKVPTPLDPSGQSSRSLGGWALGVGVGAGATVAAEALGLAAGDSSFLTSCSQPKTSVASTKTDKSFDDWLDWIASDMGDVPPSLQDAERTMRKLYLGWPPRGCAEVVLRLGRAELKPRPADRPAPLALEGLVHDARAFDGDLLVRRSCSCIRRANPGTRARAVAP